MALGSDRGLVLVLGHPQDSGQSRALEAEDFRNMYAPYTHTHDSTQMTHSQMMAI